MTTTTRYYKGREAESAAAEYLSCSGLKILDRNYRCPPGELDLVVKDGKAIVFVEVRSRRSGSPYNPEESITAMKRRRLVMAAKWYLKQRRIENSPARFDLVAIRWNGEEPEINWIVNAFEPGC